MESLWYLCLLTYSVLSTGSAGGTTIVAVNEALSGPCNDKIEDQKVVFKRGQIALDPPSPVLPGSFRIMANTTVLKELKYVAAELELRLGDWESEPLPCQEKEPDGCGGKGSCAFCKFCDEFKKLDPTVRKNGDDVVVTRGKGKSSCPISPGEYQISANVDVKDDGFFRKYLPTDLLDDLSGGKNRNIALYTTLWIYGTHFQVLDSRTAKNKEAVKAFNEQKQKWIVGCYRIVSTLKDQ